ncbi:MAG: TonB-dependent receptor [Pseudomonadota bacterium]|nr:TonB-dependent receptor [Pseudomonadota bacterium]
MNHYKLLFAFFLAVLATTGTQITVADENLAMEEIIVTARQQSEGLQDVPVTIAALTEEDLDRYNITSLVDAAKMVPNMVINHGGSGNGSSLRLRGIGSSSISAAFDHSVAINLDGVVVNRGRFIHNSYMDMRQLEILKGPQSLYFGKSATAGVISIMTNDPTDEFEFEVMAGVETEHQGTYGEMVVSGALSEDLLARFAIGFTKNDEMFENLSVNDPVNFAINGASRWYGDESLNARLTLLWAPSDDFEAKLKYNYSRYENEGGGTAWTEDVCPEGDVQSTGIPSGGAAFATVRGIDDCVINGNTSKLNLNPGLRAGLPGGYDDGEPGLDQDTNFLSLTMNWDVSDNLAFTSVTGWVDLSHDESDDYSYGAGVFGGLHYNEYESLSQELRLNSSFDGPINFQAGFFWQDIEQRFDAYQFAFNLAIMPNIFGPALALFGDFDPNSLVVGPDPATGNMYDYNKDHYLDTTVYSAMLALYWDLTEKTEVTIGARYTDEDKEGYILIPYVHAAAVAFGFGAPPRIDGLEFSDSNVSPEVAINHYLTDDISVFAAYKEGFKSGGVDNSALPTAALNPAVNGGDFSFLIYDSEEAEGFEIGMKANFLDGSMRFNATAFSYEYSDLQVQLFDSTIIQFSTFNASALETEGVEFDMLWNTNVEGLTVRSAWAWTDTVYSDDFITATGENLIGTDGVGSADITGFIGFTYDTSVNENWRLSVSSDARFTDDYSWTASLDPFVQDSFWIWDASVSLYSEDGHHAFTLMGKNLSDEYYILGGGAIPGRIPVNNLGANSLDQAATTHLGRVVSLQYRYSL